MAKSKKENKKDMAAQTTEVFYVMQKTGTVVEYVSGYNKTTGQVTYSRDVNDALWSYDSSKVDTFIANNNIPNVTTQQKEGGNHPSKPPLP